MIGKMKNKYYGLKLRRHWFDLSLFVVLGIFSWWLMSSTFGYKENAIIIDSKLYSDFGAHLPLIRSFSLGWNFPTEYPFFAGEPIRYHYLFYLMVGMLERVGFRIDIALNVLSAGGLLLLLWMIFLTTKTLFSSRLAGIVAVLLFLFNGSLSWVEYFEQNGWTTTAFLEIPKQLHFASFGPWSGRLVSAFWNWNILTNQRHLGLSYGLLLLLLYPLLRNTVSFTAATRLGWRKRVASALKGLSTLLHRPVKKQKITYSFVLNSALLVLGFSLFPLLHQAAYIILVPTSLALLVITYKNSKHLIFPYLLAVFTSLLVFLFATPQSGSMPEFRLGYLSPDISLWGMYNYWLFNLGAYWILLPFIVAWSIWRKNWWLLLAIPFFIAANLFSFSIDMINNHKLVTYFSIVLTSVTAGLLVGILKKYKVIFILPILILPLTFSGIIDFFPIINDYDGEIHDWKGSEMQQWIIENTSPRAQFLTASYMYSPASLVGRFLYLDYGYHAWSMGYKDAQKRANLNLFWAQNPDFQTWCNLLKQEKIDAILVGPGQESVEDGRIIVKDSYVVNQLLPTFESQDGWKIWKVKDICQ